MRQTRAITDITVCRIMQHPRVRLGMKDFVAQVMQGSCLDESVPNLEGDPETIDRVSERYDLQMYKATWEALSMLITAAMQSSSGCKAHITLLGQTGEEIRTSRSSQQLRVTGCVCAIISLLCLAAAGRECVARRWSELNFPFSASQWQEGSV